MSEHQFGVLADRYDVKENLVFDREELEVLELKSKLKKNKVDVVNFISVSFERK